MPTCPECGKEIEYLLEYMEAWVVSHLKPKSNSCAEGNDYAIEELIPIEELTYDCPECGEVLFYNLDEARKFIEGE